MKKYLIIFAFITMAAFMVALFSGCSDGVGTNNSNVSDVRYGIFDGECEEYNATFVYGMRENPYNSDGISNKNVEFGILSVVFLERIDEKETVNFSLTINDNTINGKLEKSPYTSEYMADIGTTCPDDATISLKISLASNDNSSSDKSITLTNQNLSWEINYENAYKIGTEALSEEVKALNKSKTGYEVYVKIITQQQTNFGTYFWAVSIVSTSGEKHTVIFTPHSEEILVKN